MRREEGFFRGFKKGMRLFGESIAAIVNSVLLFLVYFLGVGMTALFAKIFKKRFLDMKIYRRKSYWSQVRFGGDSLENHYRKF